MPPLSPPLSGHSLVLAAVQEQEPQKPWNPQELAAVQEQEPQKPGNPIELLPARNHSTWFLAGFYIGFGCLVSAITGNLRILYAAIAMVLAFAALRCAVWAWKRSGARARRATADSKAAAAARARPAGPVMDDIECFVAMFYVVLAGLASWFTTNPLIFYAALGLALTYAMGKCLLRVLGMSMSGLGSIDNFDAALCAAASCQAEPGVPVHKGRTIDDDVLFAECGGL